jgi:hypothetical protein
MFSIVLFGSCNQTKFISSGVTAPSGTNTTALSIGDTYQGGVIFYLDSNGGGLIAAPTDQYTVDFKKDFSGTETEFKAQWGCPSATISGADGTAIGTGAQNTIDIEAGCITAGTAADICANLTLGGYSDWFLPSKDELNLIWTNLADSDGDGSNNGPSDPNNLGGFAVSNYWSSSEPDSSFAWAQNFLIVSQDPNLKTNYLYVRAVRAF